MKYSSWVVKYLFSFCLLSGYFLSAQVTNVHRVTFDTQDRLEISALQAIPEKYALSYPAIVLIHQGGASKDEWIEHPLWKALLENGFVVLAYDIRNHGSSGTDSGDLMDLFNNPNRAPLDLLAAVQYLRNDERIDSDRIGIIGASIGANLAVVAASSPDYDIKSSVSLSPKTATIQKLAAIEDLKPKNVFYIASKEEQNGMRKKWAHELYDRTQGNRRIEIAPGKKHGSYILLSQKNLNQMVIDWFKETL